MRAKRARFAHTPGLCNVIKSRDFTLEGLENGAYQNSFVLGLLHLLLISHNLAFKMYFIDPTT